jgi:hypothetical protein
MMKKNLKKRPNNPTVADVAREMDRPRLAKSVREQGQIVHRKEALFARNLITATANH